MLVCKCPLGDRCDEMLDIAVCIVGVDADADAVFAPGHGRIADGACQQAVCLEVGGERARMRRQEGYDGRRLCQ